MAETRAHSPSSNIYTVLLLVALIALIAGVSYLWYRNGQLLGSYLNPFQIQTADELVLDAPATDPLA